MKCLLFVSLVLTFYSSLGLRIQIHKSAQQITKNLIVGCAGLLSVVLLGNTACSARPEGVSRPDLLPSVQTPVIDVANFLSKGQEKKIASSIEQLERTTGYKLRIVCQSYPYTPGLALKDYWGVDDNTVVLVADRGDGFNKKGIPGNLLKLNIGRNVENVLSNNFWLRLVNKLGNQPYIKANGDDIAVINAVEAITYCLEEKTCKDLPFDL